MCAHSFPRAHTHTFLLLNLHIHRQDAQSHPHLCSKTRHKVSTDPERCAPNPEFLTQHQAQLILGYAGTLHSSLQLITVQNIISFVERQVRCMLAEDWWKTQILFPPFHPRLDYENPKWRMACQDNIVSHSVIAAGAIDIMDPNLKLVISTKKH